MSDPTFLEQWVCMLRSGFYEPSNSARFVVDEAAIDSIVNNFQGPVPLQLEFANERDPSTGPMSPHTGSMLTAVEKRFDNRGAYLAGLVRTPHVSIVYRVNTRNHETGQMIGPRLVGASYVNQPLSPTKSNTDCEPGVFTYNGSTFVRVYQDASTWRHYAICMNESDRWHGWLFGANTSSGPWVSIRREQSEVIHAMKLAIADSINLTYVESGPFTSESAFAEQIPPRSR